MKRYLLTLLLAIVSAGALTACGGGDEIDCESQADRVQFPEQCMCDRPGACK